MYKIIEQALNVNKDISIVYTVLNDNNEPLVKFTSLKQAKEFIRKHEISLDKNTEICNNVNRFLKLKYTNRREDN